LKSKGSDKTHERIVSLLYSLVKADQEYKETKRRTKTYPIHIHFKRDTKEYHPDIWAKTKKKNEIDIYEVWHKEGEREACSDILHAACVDGIRYFSIVCVKNPKVDDPWEIHYARKVFKIFSNYLRNESGELLLNPEKAYIAEIGADELGDDKRIVQSLRKQLKF